MNLFSCSNYWTPSEISVKLLNAGRFYEAELKKSALTVPEKIIQPIVEQKPIVAIKEKKPKKKAPEPKKKDQKTASTRKSERNVKKINYKKLATGKK